MLSKKHAAVDQNRCVACGECSHVCPREAIKVHNGCYSVVITEICVGCGKCDRACPSGCITAKERGGQS